MTILEKNLAAFSDGRTAAIRTAVLAAAPCAEFHVVTSRTGEPTATYHGVYLHSRHDPRREAERACTAMGRGVGIRVIVGFGLGYHVEAAIASDPEGEIVVVEPSLSAFRSALEARDCTRCLGSPRVAYLIEADPESAASMVSDRLAEGVAVHRNTAVRSIHSTYCDELDRNFEALRSRHDINRNTLKRFGRTWVRNLSQNLRVIADSTPVEKLAMKHSGVPAVVFGAGPSLDDALPHARELSRRTIIVSVDTALKPLVHAGVVPDYVVIVDPQYWNTRHLDGVPETSASVISESSTHPRVFRMVTGETYFCSSLFPLGRTLESALEPFGKLGAGGSVATTAWDFAVLLGCTPIHIVGIDLGFPSRRTHFSGGFFEERMYTFCDRFQPAEQLFHRYLHDAGPYPVPATDGGEVLTDKRMIVYKWWFENQLKIHPDRVCYNLSPGGVRIDGFPYRRIDELLALRPFRAMRDLSDTGKPVESTPASAHERRAAIRSAVASLIEQLHELAKVARRGVDEVTRLREDPEASPANLDRIDEEIRALESREIAGFLMHDVVESIMNSSKAEPERASVLSSSYAIYAGILSSVTYHLDALSFGLELLKNPR